MKKIKQSSSAKTVTQAAPKASLGSLPMKLSAAFGLGALFVGIGLVGALQGSALLTSLGLLSALVVLIGGAVAVPVLLDGAIRQPLSVLARGMLVLTPESAGEIVDMASRPDAVGEVARGCVALLERTDQSDGVAQGVREAKEFARDLHRTAELLKQGQSQIAQGLVATAEELDQLRRSVSAGQQDIADVYNRAAREAEREVGAFHSVRSEIAQSGGKVADAIATLQRETAAIATQRAMLTEGMDALTRDLGAATRKLEAQTSLLAADGHDVGAALVEIADRRASFVQTIEQTTLAATRLDDMLRRMDDPAVAAPGDAGSLKASIDALGPRLDETLKGVQLVGRSLPEAAQLISTSLESIENAVGEARLAIENRIAALPAAAPQAVSGSPDAAAVADIARSAELLKQVIGVNTASIADFQAAFDLMRGDVTDLRQSFVPVVRDVQETLDRSVETLAALERVSVDIGAAQQAVLPMVEEVKTALDRTVETLAGLERVTADVERPAGNAAQPLPAQAIQPEIDQAQKLLVGLRIVIRSLGDEVETLKLKVAQIEAPAAAALATPAAPAEAIVGPDLSRRFDEIEARLSDIASAVAERPAALSGEVLPPTQDLGPEQLSFQRLLAGFRVLMRNISSESERLQQSVSRLSQDADDFAGAAGPHSERLERMLAGMSEMVGELGQRLRDAADTPAGGPRPGLGPQVFEAQQAGFERVLVGFRLLMRDLGQEADRLRGALSGIEGAPPATQAPASAVIERVDAQMKALNGSLSGLLGELEQRVSSPLSAAADNIALAVAETLASLEQRLADPVHQMVAAARECADLLRDVKRELASAPQPAAVQAPALAHAEASPALRINEVTDRVDRWIDEVDGAIAELSEDLAASASAADPAVQKALDRRIATLGELAAQMRRETGEFIAVGAAISRDLDDRSDPEPARKAAGGGMNGLFGRRKK